MTPRDETRRMRPLLGTFVEIGAAGQGRHTQDAIAAAFSGIEQIQQTLSFQQKDSELSALNAAPGEWVRLSATSLRVLRLACSMMRLSDQLFDCTVGGALVAQQALPAHGELPFLLSGEASDIEIRQDAARLRRPVRVTLDGIAKGYAVDRAIALLKQHRIPFGWVNAGGDMRVFGERILPVVQRKLDGTTQALGGLQNAALATSRVCGEADNDFPGRIVGRSQWESPLNGANASPQGEVLSVIAKFAWRADALTKVAALAPGNERAERVARLGGLLVVGVSTCVA